MPPLRVALVAMVTMEMEVLVALMAAVAVSGELEVNRCSQIKVRVVVAE